MVIALLACVYVALTLAGASSPPLAYGAPAGGLRLQYLSDTTDDAPFVIDRNSIALFDEIPDEYLAAARDLNLLFIGGEVVSNIDEALGCFTASSWAESWLSCRRDYYDADWHWRNFGQADLDNGLVPDRILFEPDPAAYNRANWTYESLLSDWSSMTRAFVESLGPAYIDSKDVLSYQFSYYNVDADSDITNPITGFFADSPTNYDIHDLEAYMAQHPDKTFVLWTTSLARGIGTQVATDFNNQMRQYAQANNMILFDIADIESYTDQGVPCYDNRDGVDYCSETGECENYPDDGQNYPAICQDYTTVVDGGPLGSVSGGRIQLAKATWVLMARIAGWDGGTGGTTSTPTPTFPMTNTPTPIPTATPTSTPTEEPASTGTVTATPSGNATSTPTSTAANPATLTAIASPGMTATGTTTPPTPSTGTATATPSGSNTGTPTPALTAVATQTPDATAQPSAPGQLYLPNIRKAN